MTDRPRRRRRGDARTRPPDEGVHDDELDPDGPGHDGPYDQDRDQDGDQEVADSQRAVATDDDRPTTSAPRRRAEAASRRVRRERDRRHRRRTVTLLVVLVLVPLLLVGGVAAWVAWEVDPPGGPGHPVELTVRKGWGVADIGDALDRHHVIGSSLVFQAYVKVTGAGPFQAGTYELHEHLGARGAATALERGPHISYATLKAVPGLRLSEMATLVGKLPGRSAKRFLAAARSGAVRSRYEPRGTHDLEGLLFPDTYEFAPWEDETTIVRTMVRRFDQVATAAGLDRESVPGVTPYQVVEVASLVQSEAKLDVDRPLIASVVYNRLRRGMPLQIDATVLYAIGQRKASNTAADRSVDSPYNTYRVTGLPPTPISSVTKASLDAAMHPADTPYLYYVLADANGKHAFAATYQEHLRNVEAARRKGLLH